MGALNSLTRFCYAAKPFLVSSVLAVLSIAACIQPGWGQAGAGDLANPPAVEATSPSTPAEVTDLDRRLAAKGLSRGAPVLIRIFKEDSELELWMEGKGRYQRFATYPICRWRGVLGPKLLEGDRQSPEGFYSFGQNQLLWQGHWFRAFNINYPNTLDRALGRTGSGILIHGACSSIGCYAMTDPVIDEIFDLVVAAFAAGQARVQVHIFPFRMTQANFAKHLGHPWLTFWKDLQPAADLLAATQVPPRIGVCDGRYVIKPGLESDKPVDKIADWCGTANWTGGPDRLAGFLEERRAHATPPGDLAAAASPPSERVLLYAKLVTEGKIPKPQLLPDHPASFGPSPDLVDSSKGGSFDAALAKLPELERAALIGTRTPAAIAASAAASGSTGGQEPSAYSCNPGLAACRHFMATHPAGGPSLRGSKLAKQ